MQSALFVLLSLVALGQANDATCMNYCTLGGNQTACSWDFTSLSDCLYWCTQFQFPLGFFNETDKQGDQNGNTIGCRLYYLNAAITANVAKDASPQCKASSITGGGVCGTRCETYCLVEQNGNCSQTYAIAAGAFDNNTCAKVCAAMPIGPTDQGMSSPPKWDNSVQCRIYHAGIPASELLVHCPHAAPHGGGACGDRCEGYCNTITATCPPANLAPFALNFASCNATCQAYLKPGGYSDIRASVSAYGASDGGTGDNLSCRTYHASAPAVASASFHCPHASLEGAGVCSVNSILATPPGNGNLCPLYCDVASVACTGANLLFNTTSACTTACALYSTVGTFQSTTGNNIHCRVYHLFNALLDPVLHCPHAGVNPTAFCIDTAPAGGSTTGTTTGTTPPTTTGSPPPSTTTGSPPPSTTTGTPPPPPPSSTTTGTTTAAAHSIVPAFLLSVVVLLWLH